MLPPAGRSVVASWCRELDRRLRAGEPVRAEDFLTGTEPLDPEDALELVYTEFVCREELGPAPDPDEYFRRFPALRAQLEEQFLIHRALHDGPTVGGQAVGPYDLVREIGRGARGAVFAARDRRDGRTVAVKLLLSGEYSTPDDLALFQHEAAALARLDHPNLIRLYEAGVADGRPYLALEYIDGPPLSRATAAFRAPGDAAALIETLARAVHHAHLQGVVHRDLKPSNILLAVESRKVEGRKVEDIEASGPLHFDVTTLRLADLRLVVSDFGLARLLDAGGGRTRTGDIVGTLAYMAPEQAAGAAHRAGPAADVYALGAILYELLTGHPPFGPDPSAVTLHRLLNEPPPSPGRSNHDVPRDLETVVLKCLEKHPDGRYPTALALADDLRRYLNGEPVAARRVGAVESARRWAIRRPAGAALVAVAALAVAVAVAGGVYHNARLRAALDAAEGHQRDTAAANADLTAALADADALRAETRRQLDDTRRVLFANQLGQLPALWPREPVRARQLLADEKVCPPELRDFTWRYFRDRCALDEQRYEAHAGGTRAVVFLPDGRLVSGGADGKLRLWPAPGTGGEPGAIIGAHDKPVCGVALLGERTFASAGQDGTVKVWEVDAATSVRTLAVPVGVNGLATHPATNRLAAGCDDGAVRVWDANTGQEVATLGGSSEPILAVAFAPDGRALAAGGTDKLVRVWDIATKRPTAVWKGHSEPVLAVAFAPGGAFVVSTDERGGVKVWNLRSGFLRDLRGHLMPVRGAAVSPTGDRIATGGSDTYLKVWDAATGQELTNVMRQDVAAVAWSPDGRWVAAGGKDGRLGVFRLPGATPVAYPHSANVAALAVRPNGGVVTADAAGEVRVWDATGAAPAVRFAVRPHAVGAARPLAIVEASAPALAVSSDGTTLAVGAGGGEVVLWDLAHRVEVGRLTGHEGNVAAVAFRPDGKVLATAGADATVRLWDVSTRQPVRTLAGHTGGVLALAWSPDGRRLASGGEDNAVRLWDADSGRTERTFVGHSIWVLALAFHPGGKTLASGSRDRTVRVWDVDGARPPLVLSGYTNWVYAVGFAPDGRTLATASGHYSIDSPGEVKLCDPDAGYVRAILTDVRAPAGFDPAGTRLYVGIRGGVAELVGK